MMTTPSNQTLTYTYDHLARLSQIEVEGTDLVFPVWLDPLNRRTFDSAAGHYTWDDTNQLLSLKQDPSSPATRFAYTYDALGRRIEKQTASLTRRYVYDNEDIIAEYDENNNLLASYLHGPGIDEPFLMQRGGSDYFLQDGLYVFIYILVFLNILLIKKF